MRTRTSAHLRCSACGGARTSPSAIEVARGWNADEDVRAPRGFGVWGCAATRPHWRPCPAPRPHSMTTSSETALQGPATPSSFTERARIAYVPGAVARPAERGAPRPLQRAELVAHAVVQQVHVVEGALHVAPAAPDLAVVQALHRHRRRRRQQRRRQIPEPARVVGMRHVRQVSRRARQQALHGREAVRLDAQPPLAGAVAERAGRDRVVLARLQLGGRQLHRVRRGHQHPHRRAGTQPQVVGAVDRPPPPRARSGSPAAARSCGGWCRD